MKMINYLEIKYRKGINCIASKSKVLLRKLQQIYIK